MLSSLLEMLNSVEDQIVRMVALASETDDMIPPAEVLIRRTGGVRCAPELLKTALIFSSSVSSLRWHCGQHLCVGWSRLRPTLSSNPSARGHDDGHRNGNQSLPLCGLFGFIGMMLSSEAAPLQPTQFSTTQGGSLNSGTEAVLASRALDLCNGLFVPHH